jgi:uncharacterized protein YbjT (DUF2867 family)
MSQSKLDIVTGAFGYTGKYIAQQLINNGHKIRTLTNSKRENPFGNKIEIHPFNFDDPERLTKSLEGSSVLYNTYWVRFGPYNRAIKNNLLLFESAKKAGIKRIVHISITNPSKQSNLEYFRGKAFVEEALQESGISYSILRPTVIFGKEGILINNIAWFLRRFPVFGMFGDGSFRIQPIYVDDLAQLAVQQGQSMVNTIIDAIGPQTLTYKKLVEQIAQSIGKHRLIMPLPPKLVYFLGRITGKILGDVLITKEEIEGLMSGLLNVNSPPVGKTKLSEWLKENAATLGRHYFSELSRRKK